MSRRLTARDYKSVHRGGLGLARWRDLALGLGGGLLVALFVYVNDHRGAPNAADDTAEPVRAAHRGVASGTTGAGANAAGTDATGRGTRSAREAASDAAARDSAESAGGSYDFYEGLPKFEVVVPEKEHGAHVDAAARIDRPGTYFLQAGSYRNAADADRTQAQLARQSITANVQRVALDTDVWYRIRIGPMKDLAQLNRVRQQLQAADIVSLVIRVED